MDAADDASHAELNSVWVSFGRRAVFRDLSCRFPRGRISVLLGGSGSGKSTALRLVAGLLRPDAGVVTVAGRELVSLDEKGLRAVRRKIGMLFQNGALLDSMSVFDNIALPLREHTRLTAAEVSEQVHRRLAAVGLEDVDDLLPGELSGGMVRRAALARAIVLDPEIVLCDEPFSGLDPPNVARIEALLAHLNRELGLTLIVSSHHVRSSLRMAHQLVLLLEGSAVSGTPQEIATSRDSRIAEFLAADTAEIPTYGELGGAP